MAEALVAVAVPETPPARILAGRCGVLAGRLADLLDTLAAPAGEALAAGPTFLRHMAASAPLVWTGPPSLDRVARALELGPREQDLLLLAGLPEEHEGYAGLLRRLHPRGEPAPTAGLAAQLIYGSDDERPALRATLERGPVVAAGVLRAGDDGPLFERSLTLADGVWSALAGADPGDGLGPIATAGLEEWFEEPAVAQALAAIADDRRLTVLVLADSEEVALERGRALVARAARDQLGVLATDGLDRRTLASLLGRSLALDAVPVIAVPGPGEGGSVAIPSVAGHPGAVILATTSSGMPPREDRPLLVLSIRPLGAHARRRMWHGALPQMDAAELATRHVVEPFVAVRAARDLDAGQGLGAAGPHELAAAVRGRAAARLPAGVAMRRPATGWDRLVLVPDRERQLREALSRLEHQAQVLDDWGFERDRPGARGVRMMFSGPPGTGKTLSAEVLASALGAELLVADISRVVSKWIGETEKNLARVFEAAERAQAVLLFDEADAFFGKRTEVSDAHDRYANLETAYLLQRLETFEGMAILATNVRQNIDAAFVRRLEFVVEYDEPALAERRALWTTHLPRSAPLADDLDVNEFASRFAITGALIRNAALAAAFLAAADGTAIGRGHVLTAVRREYDKNGRAFPAGADT
jgi:hypothetical protein